MASERKAGEPVIVWRNATDKHIHRDTDRGGLMMKPDREIQMSPHERNVAGKPPRGVIEYVVDEKEARRRKRR